MRFQNQNWDVVIMESHRWEMILPRRKRKGHEDRALSRAVSLSTYSKARMLIYNGGY